jgi:hypothetical protein
MLPRHHRQSTAPRRVHRRARVDCRLDEYVVHRKAKPKPFIRTKSAADIPQKGIRANARLLSFPEIMTVIYVRSG